MGHFKDDEEVYAHLGKLIADLMAKPAFPRYRQQLIDQGRPDLVEA